MRRKKILLVDDEESIVLGLHRVLYRLNATCDILLAPSGEIAQTILTEMPIDVMVTDVRMPGMSGLDLLTWAATASPATRVIVITAFDATQLEDRALRHGCLKIVQKPFDLSKMRELIETLLEDDGSLGGSLGSLSSADVIQMLCLSQRTTALRVVEGNSVGLMHIVRGEVVHATWNHIVGEQAVYRLLQSTRGLFHTIPLLETAATTVNLGWQQLLIEGMRLADEGGFPDPAGEEASHTALAALDGGAAAFSSALRREQARDRALGEPKEAGTERTAALIDEGFQHLRRKDYARAREVWEIALAQDPDNRMLSLNLKKLGNLEQGTS